MLEIKIGQVLKRMLRTRGLSLKELSKGAGIPYSTLHTWYQNRQPKNILKAQKLATYLNLTLHELLFDKPDFQNQPAPEEIPGRTREEFLKGKFEIIVRRLND